MSAVDPRVTRWLLWLAPFAVLALLIGFETGWGGEWRRALPPDVPATPAPVAVAVMPEYRIEGGVASMRATVDRPLFNATRRPAPTLAAADTSKPTIQRGQFVLTGTLIIDDVAVAFLKESGATGKARSVKKGDSINGMLVASIEPDRVRFSVGDETEDLELKVARGPKTTTQPSGGDAAAPAGAPGAPVARAPGADGAAAVARRSPAQGGLSGPGTATENLRTNRRAARASDAQASPQANPQPGAQSGTQAAPQPSWKGRSTKQ